nr:MAG TPA: hypothetical protein [Caudoviricetes sp.]
MLTDMVYPRLSRHYHTTLRQYPHTPNDSFSGGQRGIKNSLTFSTILLITLIPL